MEWNYTTIQSLGQFIFLLLLFQKGCDKYKITAMVFKRL